MVIPRTAGRPGVLKRHEHRGTRTPGIRPLDRRRPHEKSPHPLAPSWPLPWPPAPRRSSIDLLGEDKLQEVVLVDSRAKDKVLMIDIDGTISSALETGFLSREKSVVARVFERLERAARDPRVKAVILRLDTPGGEVTASDIVYHEVLRFKERTGRPVVGLMMSVAASGGYYIASACDVIVAHPSTLTGEHRRHLRLPQRRSADGQGRGQGRRRQVRARQGFGLAVPRHDGGGPEDLPGDHRRILRGLPRGRGPRAGRTRSRPRSSARSPTAASTPRPRPSKLGLIDAVGYFDDAFGQGPELADLAKTAKLVSYTYFPKTKTQHLRRPPRRAFCPCDAKVLESDGGAS
ncbi:MAG: S49 family peptidase [Ignavibacteriales bacterium]|nr:S49 family peptidase [Ignavibacteriales bacterium]